MSIRVHFIAAGGQTKSADYDKAVDWFTDESGNLQVFSADKMRQATYFSGVWHHVERIERTDDDADLRSTGSGAGRSTADYDEGLDPRGLDHASSRSRWRR